MDNVHYTGSLPCIYYFSSTWDTLVWGKKDSCHKNVTVHKNVPNFFTLKVRCDTLFLDNDVPIFSSFWSDVIANIEYFHSDLANKRYQLIRERHLLKLRNSLNSTCLRQFEKITSYDIEIRLRCNITIYLYIDTGRGRWMSDTFILVTYFSTLDHFLVPLDHFFCLWSKGTKIDPRY